MQDTKGRALIVGAWYAVWDGDPDEVGGAALAEWTGESFIDEGETEYPAPQFALLQHCKAAYAAGVEP